MAGASSSQQNRPPIPLWVVVSALAGVTAIVVAGYFVFFRTEYAVLYRDLRPAAAAPIVEELKKQRIPFHLSNGGADILIPASQLDEVRLDVSQANATTGGLNGFELFDNSDMGLTDFAQKIKFQRALQGELTRTILLISDVADARVHLSLPEKSLFRGEASTPKASVTLITKSQAPTAPAEVQGVQQLIASAIPELRSEDVVVLNGRGEVISAPPQPAVADASPPEDAETQALRSSLLDVLAKALPGMRIGLRLDKAALEGDAVSAAPPAAAKVSAPAIMGMEVRAARALTAEEQALVKTEIARAIPTLKAMPVQFAIEPAPSVADEKSVARLPTVVLADHSDTSRVESQAAASGAAAALALPFGAWGGLAILVIAILVFAGVLAVVLLSRRAPHAPSMLAIPDQSRFAERLKAGLAQQQQEISPNAA